MSFPEWRKSDRVVELEGMVDRLRGIVGEQEDTIKRLREAVEKLDAVLSSEVTAQRDALGQDHYGPGRLEEERLEAMEHLQPDDLGGEE